MQKPLEKPQQLAIKRARLDVQVLKQPSDAETKFHLFQRLNRGGAYANEQEVRTCAMVMVAPEFVKRIKILAANDKFGEMASIKETAVIRAVDLAMNAKRLANVNDLHVLPGNHDIVLMFALEGPKYLDFWMRLGGDKVLTELDMSVETNSWEEITERLKNTCNLNI